MQCYAGVQLDLDFHFLLGGRRSLPEAIMQISRQPVDASFQMGISEWSVLTTTGELRMEVNLS